MNEAEQQRIIERLRARKYARHDPDGSWFSHQESKHFSYQALRDMSFADACERIDEPAPSGEFWFYSIYILPTADFGTLAASYDLDDRIPVQKPYLNRPRP